jgi:hypothetical protein
VAILKFSCSSLNGTRATEILIRRSSLGARSISLLVALTDDSVVVLSADPRQLVASIVNRTPLAHLAVLAAAAETSEPLGGIHGWQAS